MNTPLNALNFDANILSLLDTSETAMKGQSKAFAELLNHQLALELNGVDSVNNIEPQVILDKIRQLALPVSSAFNLTEDQFLTLNQSLLSATSVSDAEAVKTPQTANLQHDSALPQDAALSLGLDLPNNGDKDAIVDESEVEKESMDTAAVAASQKNQPVNVIVPDTSTQTDGPSFGQVLQQQANNQSSEKSSDSNQNVTANQNTAHQASASDKQSEANKSTDEAKQDKDDERHLSSTDKMDTVDHAIMLSQLMQTSELPANSASLKKASANDVLSSVKTEKNISSQAAHLLNADSENKSALQSKDIDFKSIDLKDQSNINDQQAIATSAEKKGISLAQLNAKNNDTSKTEASNKLNASTDTATTNVDNDKIAVAAQNDNANSNNADTSGQQQLTKGHADHEQTNLTGSTASKDSNAVSGTNQFTNLINTTGNVALQSNNINTANTVYTQNINTPVGYQNWDEALGQHVGMMINNGNQSATLSLNPPDLGPLKVIVQMQNHGVADATFVTAHAEVRQAIEAAIPKLRDMLDQSGIQLGQANVDSQSNQQNAQQGQYSSSHSFRYFSQNDNMSNEEETAATPLIRKIIDQGQGAVDTFA